MSVVFSGTYTNGVVLSDPALQNPATVTASGNITNSAAAGVALLGEYGTAWTVSNLGTIAADETSGVGVALLSGGIVANGQNGAIGASILGSVGISIAGASGTVTNYGTVRGPLGGIALTAGGTVENSGTIRSGYPLRAYAILISGGAGALTNSGGITGNVGVHGGVGTVANSGTIAGGIFLDNGGGVANTAGGVVTGPVIQGEHGTIVEPAVEVSGAAGTVTNLGSMAGVVLDGGGTVQNGGTGFYGACIEGARAVGLYAQELPGVTIAGSGGVTNYGTVAGSPGIAISGPGTVVNFGTVIGDKPPQGPPGQPQMQNAVGVVLDGGGMLTNAGSISGYSGGVVFGGPGILVNYGLVGNGVSMSGGAGRIINFGIVNGGAVYLNAGGSVDNGQNGTISNILLAGIGSIANEPGGSIGGIVLGTGDTLSNSGSIGNGGVAIRGAGADDTVVNAGTIIGTAGTAVAFAGAGNLLVVDPRAVSIGIVAGAGGDTIELAAGAGSLADLGTSFTGFSVVRVDPGALWSVSGSGSRFINDGTVAVDSALVFEAVSHDPGDRGVIDVGGSGAGEFAARVGNGERVTFTAAGGNVLLNRPLRFEATIDGFAAGATIDLVGKTADGFSFAHHMLEVTENGRAVADLHLAGRYTTSEFSLSADGDGGTDITFASTARASFWTPRG